MARTVEEVEFAPRAPQPVLGWMHRLAVAHDGWINFIPGVPEDAVGDSSPSVFSTIFGNAQAPVSMCTWMPPRAGRGPRDEATVGITHPKGRYAVRQLAELGVEVPPGWRVRQDHARRGLIVHPPATATDEGVLDWLLRAGAALAVVPLTGTWKAVVYLPRTA